MWVNQKNCPKRRELFSGKKVICKNPWNWRSEVHKKMGSKAKSLRKRRLYKPEWSRWKKEEKNKIKSWQKQWFDTAAQNWKKKEKKRTRRCIPLFASLHANSDWRLGMIYLLYFWFFSFELYKFLLDLWNNILKSWMKKNMLFIGLLLLATFGGVQCLYQKV